MQYNAFNIILLLLLRNNNNIFNKNIIYIYTLVCLNKLNK